MTRPLAFQRRWFWLVTLLAAAGLVARGLYLQGGNGRLRAAVPFSPLRTLAPVENTGPAPEAAPTPSMVAEWRADIARENAARAVAEQQIAELEKRLPVKDGEVIVSFGSVEQMAQRTAQIVDFFIQQSIATKDGRKMTAEVEAQAGKWFAEFFPQMGELRAMEDDAKEIARFNSTILGETFGLDGAARQRVRALLETEFVRLKAVGLTASAKPEEAPQAWEKRRDAAIIELATRVCPLLPPNHPQLELLPGILNISGGTRTEVIVGSDGRGAMNLRLPLFPDLRL